MIRAVCLGHQTGRLSVGATELPEGLWLLPGAGLLTCLEAGERSHVSAHRLFCLGHHVFC